MPDIPILETERLLLRAPTIEDWPSYLAFMASERSKYMGGPLDTAGAWAYFCHDSALWQLMGHGALMMDIKETGQCIGQVGINHGPLFPERELGWMVTGNAEGNGYAFEAAYAMLNWAFETQQFQTVVSYIDPDNERSISLAKRLGGKMDPNAPRDETRDLVFRYNQKSIVKSSVDLPA